MVINKTAHYRISEFIFQSSEQTNNNLQLSELLAESKEYYELDSQPFSYGVGLECIVVDHQQNEGFEFLHLVTFEEGAGAAVISNIQGANIQEVDELGAPIDNEFIRSQLFLICKGNDIIWVSHNSALRAGSVKSLLKNLLKTFHPNKNLPNLLLSAPVNKTAFQQLIHEGIDSIDLKTTSSRQQLEYIKNNGKVPISILSLLGMDNIDEDALDAASKLKSVVTLKAGRAWEHPKVKVLLETISNKLIEEVDDDEGFVIRTKQGHKLTEDIMTITLKLNIPGNSRTLDVKKTFYALRSGFGQMKNSAG